MSSNSNKDSPGYIYILVNPSFPGYVKIGRTKNNPEERAKQLSSTGVPASFQVAFLIAIVKYKEIEQLIHEELKNYRIEMNREFFSVNLETACKKTFESASPFLCNSQQVIDMKKKFQEDKKKI